MAPTLIITNRGNAPSIYRHLTTQRAINLHKCNVFDMLLSSSGDSQPRANENPINRRLNKKSVMVLGLENQFSVLLLFEFCDLVFML